MKTYKFKKEFIQLLICYLAAKLKDSEKQNYVVWIESIENYINEREENQKNLNYELSCFDTVNGQTEFVTFSKDNFDIIEDED